ncbi:MAG: hypothetical protein V1821_04075 [bacterium]
MYSCGKCARHFIWTFAVIGLFAFLVCFLWQYVLIDPSLKTLHESLMKIAIIGFTGNNIKSVLLGLFEFAIYGAIFGGLLSIAWQSHHCEQCRINIFVEK